MHSRSVAAHPRKCVVSAGRREAKSRSASKLIGSSVTCIWTPPRVVFAFFDSFMVGALASRFFRPCGRSRRLRVSGPRNGCELDPAGSAVMTSTSPRGGAGPSSCSSCLSPLVRSAATRALCALIRSSIFAAACRRCSAEKIGGSNGTYREASISSCCAGPQPFCEECMQVIVWD